MILRYPIAGAAQISVLSLMVISGRGFSGPRRRVRGGRSTRVYRIGFVRVMKCIDSDNTDIQRSD